MSKFLINIIFVISNMVINLFFVYFCNRLLDNKLKIINKKNIVIIIIMTIVSVSLNNYCPQPFKFILSFLFLIGIGYIVTEKRIVDSVILIIFFQINIIVSEMIYSMIVNLIVNDYSSTIVVTLSNIIIPGIGLIILKTGIPNKFFSILLKISKKMKNKEILTYSFMVILIIIISIAESYMNIPLSIVVVTNTIMALVIIAIIVKFITTKNNYQVISNKYQTSINSLKEYEIMIDKYRVNNHENKNEFLTIRNMIKNKDSKTIEYIDKLIDNKIKDNEKIMKQTQKIPEGGLRATIYSKLCVMDKYKIKYNLDIAKDVKTVDLINLDEELILNICKILGVFLDNAIEEVQKIKKKNIDIEIYVMDGKLCIDITNNYSGKINSFY